MRQGSQVREDLLVPGTAFTYDTAEYGTSLDDLQTTTQFPTRVVVQRQGVERTRAKFDPPWSVSLDLDCDEELVDERMLRAWFDIAGRRFGLRDWRPTERGPYGRFQLADLLEVA